VTRLFHFGRPYLSSLLSESSLPLYPDIEAIISALWDRTDTRPTIERLQHAPDIPQNTEHLEFLMQKLLENGLLISADFDEKTAWIEMQEAQMPSLPMIDQVELTNACPFTCLFCPRGLGKMRRSIGHLDLGLLADIAAQVKDRPSKKPFGLHHFGEPLLHPDPAQAVRIVSSAGLEAEISFNPILLRQKIAEDLLDAGIGVVIISMDGLDTSTLIKIRGKHAGPYEQVEANVEMFLSLVSRMSKPPTVMISMVGTTHNRHQWREIFDRYQRPEYPWLQPVVRLLEDFGDPDIIPIGLRPLRQLCASPYNFVSVLWDGSIVPCCHDFDGKIILGNAKNQTLSQIWHGETFQHFRERWKNEEFAADEPCTRCRWRVELYMAENQVADTDAWTPALWPEKLFPA
jgi:radical SAM protein with 4Fe4S-binding SPASM domain